MFVEHLYGSNNDLKIKFFEQKTPGQKDYMTECLDDSKVHKFTRGYAFDQATRFITKLYTAVSNKEFIPAIINRVGEILFSNTKKTGL